MTPATILLLMLVSSAATGAPDSARISAEPPAWERYEQVVDLNIFVRSRGRRSSPTRREGAQDAAPVAMPAPHLVLRGVSRRGDAWIAFVEDIRSERVLRVTSGDELNGGRVESVSIAGIKYRYGEATVDVIVGGMVGGSRSAPDAAVSAEATGDSSTSSTTGAKSAAAGKADKESSILERLRRKREAQLGKSKAP